MLTLLLVGPLVSSKILPGKKKCMFSANSYSSWSALLAAVVFRSFVFVFFASYNKNFNVGGISDIFGMTGMKNVLWNFNFLLLGDIEYK